MTATTDQQHKPDFGAKLKWAIQKLIEAGCKTPEEIHEALRAICKMALSQPKEDSTP